MDTFSKAEVMFLEADSKLQNGNYKEGVELLEEIIKIFPNFAPAYNHMGWLYFVHFSNLKRAEFFFKKTIVLDTEYAPVYPNYAAVLNSLERYEELEELIDTALEIKNVDIAALQYERGTMYEIQEDFEKADESFRKAVKFSLSNSEVRIYSEALERITIKKGLSS